VRKIQFVLRNCHGSLFDQFLHTRMVKMVRMSRGTDLEEETLKDRSMCSRRDRSRPYGVLV
jgi:hypothetical protein